MISDLIFLELLDSAGRVAWRAIEALWDAFLRVLNLPILLCVWVDCLAGAAFGWGLVTRDEVGLGAWTLGVLLLFTPAFALGSTFAWRAMVEGEEDDATRESADRVRYPFRPGGERRLRVLTTPEGERKPAE